MRLSAPQFSLYIHYNKDSGKQKDGIVTRRFLPSCTIPFTSLFDAASLMGYSAEGICYGMQVENMSPAEFVVGLTPKVHSKLPLLVESVVAELTRAGHAITKK